MQAGHKLTKRRFQSSAKELAGKDPLGMEIPEGLYIDF